MLELFDFIRKKVGSKKMPQFELPRKGDISHSLGDISKAESLLDYQPVIDLEKGMEIMIKG